MHACQRQQREHKCEHRHPDLIHCQFLLFEIFRCSPRDRHATHSLAQE
jgi:hypothetical protein